MLLSRSAPPWRALLLLMLLLLVTGCASTSRSSPPAVVTPPEIPSRPAVQEPPSWRMLWTKACDYRRRWQPTLRLSPSITASCTEDGPEAPAAAEETAPQEAEEPER